MKIIEANILEQYLLLIEEGLKHHEFRLNAGKWATCQVGDIINLSCEEKTISVFVTGISHHKNWEEILDIYPDSWDKSLSREELLKACNFYKKEDEKRCGLLAIAFTYPVDFMEVALKLAKEALDDKEIPVGAVITRGKQIVGLGKNSRQQSKKIDGHAEINAIKDAEHRLGRWQLDDCSIYVNLEPCPMCSGAILQSRLKNVIFALKDKKDGAVVSNFHLFDGPNAPIVVQDKGNEEESKNLIQKTFSSLREEEK